MDVIRIAVLGIAGLFLCIFLKDTKPEYALYVSLATGVCILLLATGKLSYLMEMLNRLKSYVPHRYRVPERAAENGGDYLCRAVFRGNLPGRRLFVHSRTD